MKKFFLKVPGEALIIGATMVAALGWLASKEVIQVMPFAIYLGIRFLFAALVLLPLCLNDIRRLEKNDLIRILFLGVLLNIAMLIWAYALSISRSMGEGAFIISSAVLFAPLTGWLLFRKRPEGAFWLSFPIALVGIACLSLKGNWEIEVSQLFFVLSACLLSMHFNLNKLFTNKVRTLPLVCLQLGSAGIFSLCISFFLPQQETHMTFATWGWLIAAIVLSTSLRYVLQTSGQQRVSIVHAAAFMVLEPVWVLILGFFCYDETLSLQKIVGCCLVLVSLTVFLGDKKRKR